MHWSISAHTRLEMGSLSTLRWRTWDLEAFASSLFFLLCPLSNLFHSAH